MVSDRNNLDYSAGSGALDTQECLIDNDTLIEADGRSDMETSFNPSDADNGLLMSDGKRRTWNYLYKQNENHYGDDKGTDANIRRDAATFCGHADLTEYQQQRVLFHVDRLDINDFGQTSTEAVILALIAYVANLDDRWIQREQEFRELQNSLEISSDKVKRVTRQVQDKVDQ